MSFTSLLLKNLLRNKRRTLLTLASLAASIFLIATMEGLLQHMENSPRVSTGELRLIVRRKTSLQDRLPESYLEKVRALPEVDCATPMTWFGGFYLDRRPENFFGQLSCDPEVWNRVIPEARVVDPVTRAASPALYEEFMKDRTGAIAAADLFKKYGWKLGDKITIQGMIYPCDLVLTLRAAYHADRGTDNGTMYFHHKYIDELLGRPGLIGIVSARAKSTDVIPALIDKIDSASANSDFETLTETEASFQLSFLQMLGNIQLLVRYISLAVGFAMLMVAANTTAMAARERAHEIAVMKALGFVPSTVLTLMLAEAGLLGLIGSTIGAGLALGLCPLIEMALSHSTLAFFFQNYLMAAWIPIAAVATGTLVGVLSATVPCTHVALLPIATTIRRSG